MKTYSRTREQGTHETIAGNPQDRINAIRQIVNDCQYAKVDGTMIDLFTASTICQVYDALSDENKIKFASLPAYKMGALAFKLVS